MINREQIREMLDRWQSGNVSANDVHAWANDLYDAEEWPVEDEIINDVMSNLDILDINLITVDDIPLFLDMLTYPPQEFDLARRKAQLYWKAVDIEERKKKYAGDPFYQQFCMD